MGGGGGVVVAVVVVRECIAPATRTQTLSSLLPSCSLTVAYLLLASGHACLLHSPVTLYSFRQKVLSRVLQRGKWFLHYRPLPARYLYTCQTVLRRHTYFALNEQKEFLIIPHTTYTYNASKQHCSISLTAPALTSSLCIVPHGVRTIKSRHKG